MSTSTTIKQGADEQAQPVPAPLLTREQIRRTLMTMAESLVAIRNAARCSKIEGTARERWNIADEIEEHGKRAFALAEQIRREAK